MKYRWNFILVLMTLTLLLDLDDTLISNSMDTFLPGYLQKLSSSLAPYAKPGQVVADLMTATHQMIQNQNPEKTLEQVFDAAFYPAINVTKDQLVEPLSQFYTHEFPHLQILTKKRPQAVEFVENALQRGYRIAIATAPLFPREAILERLRWAGLSPDQFSFALIPDFSSFHFAKPNPAYFAELLALIGWPEGPVLMVGDDLTADISGAQALGLPVYWIRNGYPPNGHATSDIPQGEIENLLAWIDSYPVSELKPDFSSPQALCAILKSTPAAIFTLCQSIQPEWISQRQQSKDWAPVEIISHLRDVEIEVNLPRLKQALSEQNPFIAARDTDQWAEERNYLQQSFPAALADFLQARVNLVNQLENLPLQEWQRSLRHAIFGPTTLLELVQFMADHDRLHIRQLTQIKKD